MKIQLLTIEYPSNTHYHILCDDYIDRIAHYIPIEWKTVRAERIATLTDIEIRAKEAERLFAKISSKQRLVAMDCGGVEMNTAQFAHWLQKNMLAGEKYLAFIIGGSLGLDAKIIQRAEHIISLSQFTLAHELAAVVLLEQLYRVLNMLHGGKYHK